MPSCECPCESCKHGDHCPSCLRSDLILRQFVESCSYADGLFDINGPNVPVEVKVSGSTLWINVGPVCVLRICRAKEIKLEGK